MDNKHFVYTHTSPSGKVYVGQTVNIKRRWGTNGEHYTTKKKDSSYIQQNFARAILKYGWKNFEHKVVLENISKSEADYAEKYLIRWYKMHNMSYNITDGGEGVSGVRYIPSEEQRKKISQRLLENHPMRGKHWSPEILARITEANRNRTYTEEQRAAMSERARKANLGKKASEETKKKLSEYRKAHPETWIGGWNKKEIHQYGADGKYIQSFSSATEAGDKLSIGCGDILRCANGIVLSAGGFIWKFVKIDSIDTSGYRIVYTAHGARIIDMSEESRLRRSAAHGRPVNQYSLDGEYIATYCTASEASRQTGINYSGIQRCCKHEYKFKTAGGYKWEYDNGNNRTNIAV